MALAEAKLRPPPPPRLPVSRRPLCNSLSPPEILRLGPNPSSSHKHLCHFLTNQEISKPKRDLREFRKTLRAQSAGSDCGVIARVFFHADSRVYGEHTPEWLVFTPNMSYEAQKMDVRSGSSGFNKARGEL